jgi:hypothetical protein
MTGIIGLPTPLQDQATMSAQPEPDARYAYKASLIGAAHRFELTDQGLSWQVGGKSGIWAYRDIASIRLSYRPVSMQSHRFRADIENTNRQRLVILSTSWQTAALMAPQDRDYRAFIELLHRRLAEAGSHASLIGGIGPWAHNAALAVLALVAVSVTGLLVRAIATGEWAGALFLVGFAALFARQIGGFVRRNTPRAYGFGDLPQALLP